MRIQFVEVQNFRKLRSIRIDLSEKTTLLVGANNSGKTSAMVALGHFLVDHSRFTTNDFTLSNWVTLNKAAADWEAEASKAVAPPLSVLDAVLPALDVWLEVAAHEVHYVKALLPTLDWSAGRLGVRLRFEPKTIADLHKEYLTAITLAKDTKRAATAAGKGGKEYDVNLWPADMCSFLGRRLRAMFTVRAYLLDPAKCEAPKNGLARPQPLPDHSEPIEGNPLVGLIRIDEIAAQRGFADTHKNRADVEGEETQSYRGQSKLSEQLRGYYSKHLNPTECPEPSDLEALQAIETAQQAFNGRLRDGFSPALEELASLNYPGITDPKLTLTTQLRPIDGLNHSAAVQYEVVGPGGENDAASLILPEDYNGLGYQNLISMVFKLMAFRDDWMRVGKASKIRLDEGEEPSFPPPLHLVLIEEPEAHLHCQVQQVFVKQAYDVLRNHPELRDKPALQTQLIVSTHSSHIAHECSFSSLRYFRRLPPAGQGNVPTSAVINLSEVFGPDDATDKFVTRYLRTTHCDLFFADAAILIEGAAERMLVPYFIQTRFPVLNRCHVTLLEIGGSHAHRLRPLIEHLGLTTLVITDLDSRELAGRHPAAPPQRGAGQITGNVSLKTWHPTTEGLDALLDLAEDKKTKEYPEIPLFAVRVAYQAPITVKMGDNDAEEALATTFEDSLVFENLDLFSKPGLGDIAADFTEKIAGCINPAALSHAMFNILKTSDKAAFALELLSLQNLDELKTPKYIENGLKWLEGRLVPATTTSSAANP